MAEKKLNILVLAGGESTEREVSLTSAEAVVASLTRSGHNVRTMDSADGTYLTYVSGKLISEAAGKANISEPGEPGKEMSYPVSAELARIDRGGIDVVFNALHGGTGENGGIQAVLDILRIPYTGSPMAASAIAMNKDIAKRVMMSLGIPTARWVPFAMSGGKTVDGIAAEIEAGPIAVPLIIKPNDGGSTVGLSLVEENDQIVSALQAAFTVSGSVMVEEYVGGREITISVLDGEALPPVEIKPTHKLYDYTCKYTKGKSEYICPAVIDEEMVRRLSDDAVRFYDTIGCRGYARVDFIVAPDGRYVCLELNTLPGMTGLSLFPMAAKAVGIEFDALLDKLCRLALEGR